MGWLNWVLVIAGFSLLIVLHEFGHFIVAKWTGMRVERFFLFFPPKLVSIKRGETEYGIGAIPLGGFVKITGMNPEELEPRDPSVPRRPAGLLERVESADQGEGPGVSRPGEPLPPELMERAYYNQPVWKRIAVIAAGPAMNVLIAFLILFVLAFSVKEATTLEVEKVEGDAPAAGVLQEGDELLAIDGVPLRQKEITDRAEAFAEQLNTHRCTGEPADGCRAATPATIVVEREGRRQAVQAVPVYDEDAPPLNEGDDPGRYRLGFEFGAADPVSVGYSAPEAAEWAADTMWEVTSATASIFARIFQEEQREQLSGVVGISAVGNEAINVGAWEAFALLGLVSLSLAIINLFPFLPLDGGHIFWSLVEKVRGRRVPFSVIERASAVGFLLVLFLFFIGLSNDIGRLTGEGFEVR
jgi:regulator of sigma E protease